MECPTGECRRCTVPGCRAWDHSRCSTVPSVQGASHSSLLQPDHQFLPPTDAGVLVQRDTASAPRQWNDVTYSSFSDVEPSQTHVPTRGGRSSSSSSFPSAVPPLAYPSRLERPPQDTASRTDDNGQYNFASATLHDVDHLTSHTLVSRDLLYSDQRAPR